jgi:hypothetical protein
MSQQRKLTNQQVLNCCWLQETCSIQFLYCKTIADHNTRNGSILDPIAFFLFIRSSRLERLGHVKHGGEHLK